MRSLAEFLRQYRDSIVTTWCAGVAALPSATGQGRRGIRDHLPELLDELARSLDDETASGAALDKAGATHAKDRFAAGYDIREVVTEYQMLRQAILDAYARHAVDLSEPAGARIPALTRLDGMIDAAICDSVDRFVAERDRAKDVLVGILGHDLRTPLQSILMGADTLAKQGDALGPTVSKVANRITSSATRMGRMIEDLLDFTRAHLGGGIPVVPAPMDLSDVVTAVVDELSHAHPSRLVRRVPSASGDLRGEWDAARIAQAVTNLVGNAIQHGADPVEVKTVGDDTNVIVEVHNGGTIAPNVAERLFQPFAHAAERMNGGSAPAGLGLGLYIVAEIARAHAGRVEVDSADGITCFRLVLPRPPPGS